MEEFPSHQSDSGGCLIKIVVFLLIMGLASVLLLGIVTGIVLASVPII